MNKNLPLGAEHDPRAPWNEKEQEKRIVELDVSTIISKFITIEIPKNATSKEILDILTPLVEEDIEPTQWEIGEIDWEGE